MNDVENKAWLIELRSDWTAADVGSWFGSYGDWTRDPNQAIRFTRRQDAETMIRILQSARWADGQWEEIEMTATEHLWID